MNENPLLMRTLLVPLDGSHASEGALPWALELAAKHQAEIVLLRVGREPNILEVQDIGSLEAFLKDQEEKCRQYLQEVKAHLKSNAFVRVRLDYASGLPAKVILAKARDLGISMIVMNSHGRDGVTRWWMGSVAEQVSRHAPCPVLLVRQDDPDHSQTP